MIARLSLDELEGIPETLTSKASEMLKHKGIRLTRRMREDRNSYGQSRQKANSQMVCPILQEPTPRELCHQSGSFPAQVQGQYIENYFDDYLLLEPGIDSILLCSFEGIYQFWIRKDEIEGYRWDSSFATDDGS